MEDKDSAPHSDTILLVRFDPEQGQTSVLSIPRDLMVNITTPSGQVDPEQKINAAYTIGSQIGGPNEASVLAAETIKHEVFPELQLNGIIDVNFSGFINVVDTLGCAYVNVDHRYLHEKGENGEEYTTINLEPGYQRLCYENALDYVRYRHDDSDFVRVARQQDFLRDLREQIDPSNELGQIDTVAKAVGHAIRTNFRPSASELILLSKLIAFSQAKPLRQVKFMTNNVDAQLGGVDYVTSTPNWRKKPSKPSSTATKNCTCRLRRSTARIARTTRATLTTATTTAAASRRRLEPRGDIAGGRRRSSSKPPRNVPFPVLYPKLQTGQSEQQQVRAYTLKNQQNIPHHAYVVVWRQNQVERCLLRLRGH